MGTAGTPAAAPGDALAESKPVGPRRLHYLRAGAPGACLREETLFSTERGWDLCCWKRELRVNPCVRTHTRWGEAPAGTSPAPLCLGVSGLSVEDRP